MTPESLLRWSGALGVAAGLLTILANVLHPPRTFEGFAQSVRDPLWEPIHALGIAAFLATIFALIGLFARQINQIGRLGLSGFVLATTGIVLAVGVLAADSFLFPILGSHATAAMLLEVPGPIIPNSSFGVLMATSAITYNLGYLLFGIAGWRARILPRWGFALLAVGVVPLSVGALAAPGIDVAGALAVGAGHIALGRALWREPGMAS